MMPGKKLPILLRISAVMQRNSSSHRNDVEVKLVGASDFCC